jgi:hypothetical protein
MMDVEMDEEAEHPPKKTKADEKTVSTDEDMMDVEMDE